MPLPQVECKAFEPLCSVPGCGKAAGPLGRCRRHENQRLRQNTSDGVRAGGKRKLSDEDLVIARRMLSAFKTKREVAGHLGVSPGALTKALARKKKDA
jgi:hypothetical protein